MPLSIKQVRYFIAAAEAGQVSQAAVELNISQSAVTAALQQLEQELGVSLFSRHAGGVSLTAEGARFLQHARNIMAAVNEATSTPLTEDTAQAGRIRVGMSYTVVGYLMPRHHARFCRNYPRIRVDLVELPRKEIERELMEGKLDLAVILVDRIENHARIASERLIRSQRRLWLPVEHPLLKAEHVTLQDVAREPYVMLTVDEASQTVARYWKPTGLTPKVILRTSSVEAVRSLVAAGMGLTILSDMVYRPWSLEGQRILTRNLLADIPTMDAGLAWDRDRALSPAARIFHNFLTRSFSGAAQSSGEA